MTRHVVFGTGQVGGLVIEQLVAGGHATTAVSRSGRRHFDAARNLAGDATDPAFCKDVCSDADIVYFCLDAPDYDRWPEQYPPLQHGVLTGAIAAGARLVVLENMYAYGPHHGVLDETLPLAATSAKGRTRAALTEELLRAHERGDIEVAIGRASDYFGPGATHSALGELVFDAAIRGKTAQIMGNPDCLHSYSYTPDVATALIQLGTHEQACGHVWHLPVAETTTTRDVIEQIYRLGPNKPRLFAAKRWQLRLYGLVKPEMREYLHTLYQFSHDWVVSDARYRGVFGNTATPLGEALATTYNWYAQQATSR